jgi:hypothetical protein
MLLQSAQISIELHIILNFLLQQFVSDTFFVWTTYILRQGFKLIVCVTLVRKAADEIILFFQIFHSKQNK